VIFFYLFLHQMLIESVTCNSLVCIMCDIFLLFLHQMLIESVTCNNLVFGGSQVLLSKVL
jgi:hypothetical protein